MNTGDMIVMDLARPAEIHRVQHRVISLSARIERARLVLLSADCQLRVGEIAFRSGFSEHSSFDRMFRRRYGMTPGEMRQIGVVAEA